MSTETLGGAVIKNNRRLSNPSRLVSLAVFIALAIVAHTLESGLIVSGALPGVKFGIANVLTLLVLHYYGSPAAFVLTLARIIGGSILTGTVLQPAFLFSLSGGLIGVTIMITIYKLAFPRMSFVGISLMAAMGHNIAQMVFAAILIANINLWPLLPLLLASGLLFGTINGVIANMVTTRLLWLANRRKI